MSKLNVGFNVNTQAVVLAVIAIALGFYLVKKTKDTVAAVGTAVNPINPNNVANKAANSVFQAVYNPGNDPRRVDTIGTWLGGLFDDYDPNGDVPVATLPKAMRVGALQLK